MYHYKPKDGYFGDPIPFFWDDAYHLFYLKAPLEPKRHWADFTSYAHVSTREFLHWTEHPPVIAPTKGEPDALGCWTGSIIEKEGTFYLFYTGHDKEHSSRPQSICLATSENLDDWHKSTDNPILLPDPNRYNIHHWRDPFVFWSEDERCYVMIITTVLANSCLWKGGALAVARSSDLLNWEPGEVIYHPGNHGFPECSDLFQIDGKWYLVCSIFDKTCYRIGDSPLGPWRGGKTDSFDGVLNYAGKTLFDGHDRYIIGWIRTKVDNKDSGAWEWGGHLSFPRQIIQGPDGSVYGKLPEQFMQLRGRCKFDLGVEGSCQVVHGHWNRTAEGLHSSGHHLYAEVSFPGDYSEFDMTLDFAVDEDTRTAGIVIQNDSTNNHPGYEIALDFRRQMLLFRKHAKRFGCYTFQDVIIDRSEPIRMRVIVERTIVEIFVNDKFALSSRFYHFSEQAGMSFFVEEGSATIRSAEVFELSEAPHIAALQGEGVHR